MGGDQMPVDEPVSKVAASAQMLVNKAIVKAVNAAVIVELGGELGPLIDKVAANAQMPVDEPMDKAVARTRHLK